MNWQACFVKNRGGVQGVQGWSLFIFSSNLYVNKQGSMQDAVLQHMQDAVLQHIEKSAPAHKQKQYAAAFI